MKKYIAITKEMQLHYQICTGNILRFQRIWHEKFNQIKRKSSKELLLFWKQKDTISWNLKEHMWKFKLNPITKWFTLRIPFTKKCTVKEQYITALYNPGAKTCMCCSKILIGLPEFCIQELCANFATCLIFVK